MSTSAGSDYPDLPEAQMLRINRLCNQFESLWRLGTRAAIEDVLSGIDTDDRLPAVRELLPLELEYRRRAGVPLSLAEYTNRFPQVDREWLANLVEAAQAIDPQRTAVLQALPDKLGDYRIVTQLGSGGMGTVYKAVHERMGRTVALKVLRPEIQRDPLLLRRFDREVRVAATLSHPNIVAALDAREQDGVHYLITEFVDGADLARVVRENGPLSVADAVDCIAQAARGLDYAHQHGIVHRDIKPANLLRDAGGVVKVLDMGLARWEAGEDAAATELTHSGMVMGTAAYMAPEQARDTRRADARSDIYSLGCTLYYLLHGRSPFTGDTPIDAIVSHLRQAIPALDEERADVPAALDDIFRRMVAKEPADRYQSAMELIAALESVRGDLPTGERTSPVARRTLAEPAATINMAGVSTARPAIADSPHLARPSMPRTSSNAWRWAAAAALLLAALATYAALNDSADPASKRPLADALSPDGSPPANSSVLVFNGHSSYVAAPEIVPVAGATYTLEAFAAPGRFRTSHVISWLGPDWMALFLSQDGQWGLARYFGDQPRLIHATQPASLNTMVHVAGVYDRDRLTLFVDGRAVETVPTAFGIDETSGGLFIGGVPANRLPANQNDRFFDGRIRAVRISRGVRYKNSFASPTQLAADEDTIALFSFDAGTGQNITGAGERDWPATIVDADWQVTR